MQKELEQKLVERWPRWFNPNGDIKNTSMPLGFLHDDGWFDILARLCEDLEPLVREFELATGSKFEILQVKEKFGGLRIYVNDANDAIRERIEVAKQESASTCEVCGERGALRHNGGTKTLCDEHALAHEARKG